MAKTLDESVGDLMAAMGAMNQRSQRAPSFAIGKVVAGTQAGLRVQCGGNVLTAEQIWCNEAMLEEYSPKLEGTLTGTCPDGGTVTPVTKDQLKRAEFALKEGDRVALLTENQQIYYVICKVVPLV